MPEVPQSREQAEAADRSDPLAAYRDQFVIRAAAPIYLDGNSLGRPPRATGPALHALVREWGEDLVGGWDRWSELPRQVGDRIGQLIGAGPGQVVMTDSTTVNLYKLAAAALSTRPHRSVIVGDANDFPTVRYVLQGVAAHLGHRLHLVSTTADGGADAIVEGIRGTGSDTALVCLSAVNFRSGAVSPMAEVTDAARRAGALTLWDLSHAAGAVPLDLDGDGVDLAVGCSYKYLNGGPGAPAWAYVRSGLQAEVRQPIWGWWGQRHQFDMGALYDPAPSIDRFMTGTPAVLGMVAVDCGIAPLLAAGMPALWAKTRQLVDLLAWRAGQRLVPLGAHIASPVRPERRGGHLAVGHPDAYSAARLLIDRGLVITDFRPPDVLRLAPVAVYTRFVDVWDAVESVAGVLTDPAVHVPQARQRVT